MVCSLLVKTENNPFNRNWKCCTILQINSSIAEAVTTSRHFSFSRGIKLNVTSAKEILLCVETYTQQENEWPLALITKALNTFDGQVCKVQGNVMKWLCNGYIRFNSNALRLGIEFRHDRWLMSGAEELTWSAELSTHKHVCAGDLSYIHLGFRIQQLTDSFGVVSL